MVWWDQELRTLVSSINFNINLRLLLRYVDDLNLKSGQVPVGSVWDKETKQITVSSSPTPEQLQQPADLRTALVARDMADSVTDMFKWTVDCPSLNLSKKIPVLDLQLWTEETPSGTIIHYEFFRKEMANTTTIPSDSAFSWRQKMITFRQEAQRIMRNTSPLLPWSTRARHLSMFSWRLKQSGYGPKVRAKVIAEGVRAHEKLEARHAVTGQPINRPKGSVEEQETRRQNNKKKEWFSKNQSSQELKYTATMFIPPTPNSVLVRELQAQERLNNQGRDWGIKFVERRGTTVDSILSKSYPWPTLYCEDPKCFPCSTADQSRPPRWSCRTPGVAYRVTCLLCKETDNTSTYEGESGRNAYSRGKEHLRDLTNNSKESPLVNHQQKVHPGQPHKFRMTILKTFRQALDRQIEEATRIEETGENPLQMNSRSEWRSTPLPQLGLSQGRVAKGAQPTYTQLPGSRPRRPRDNQAHHLQAMAQQSPQHPQQHVRQATLGEVCQAPQAPQIAQEPQEDVQHVHRVPQGAQQRPQQAQDVPQQSSQQAQDVPQQARQVPLQVLGGPEAPHRGPQEGQQANFSHLGARPKTHRGYRHHLQDQE